MSCCRIELREEGDGRFLVATLRPEDPGDWVEVCERLAVALGGAGRVLAVLKGPAEPGSGPGTRLTGEPREALGLVEAAARLRRARLSLEGPLAVRAEGLFVGPLLTLALSAELLVAGDGMAAEALFWEDSRLLVPGELSTVAARLGRARALEWALLGGRLEGGEAGALSGEAGERAFRSLRSGSLTAQSAALRLLRNGGRSRAGAEALERVAFALCFAEADRTEGLAAFTGRREPDFPSNRSETSSRGPG